jgi:arylformamidase
MPWIDITVPIRSGMPVWPSDPGVVLEQAESIEQGDVCNVTRLRFSAHTGTHMDAPCHFIDGASSMGEMPLDAVLGPCRVIGIEDPVAVRPAELPADLAGGERILFKTRNSARDWWNEPFREDFVYISQDAARVLALAGVRTVGIDYLSVGGYRQDTVETHHQLLCAGIWVIEGLDLTQASPGRYELACLPLRIPGADGAPARAALRI